MMIYDDDDNDSNDGDDDDDDDHDVMMRYDDIIYCMNYILVLIHLTFLS